MNKNLHVFVTTLLAYLDVMIKCEGQCRGIHSWAKTLWPPTYYAVGPLHAAKTALTHRSMDSRRCPLVSATKNVRRKYLKSCKLWGGAAVDLTDSAYTTDAQYDWDLGNLEARATPWTLCHVLQTFPEHFVQCGRRIILLKEAAAIRNTIGISRWANRCVPCKVNRSAHAVFSTMCFTGTSCW